MVRDGERFDQGGLVEGDVTDRVNPTLVDDDLLAQAATAAGEADEAHLFAQVVVAGLAGRTFAADEVRFDDHVVPDVESFDAVADLLDGSGELMAESDGQ